MSSEGRPKFKFTRLNHFVKNAVGANSFRLALRRPRLFLRALVWLAGGALTAGVLFTNCGHAILGPATPGENQGVTNGPGSQTVTASSSSCPAGQVPIGIDASSNLICASMQTVAGTSGSQQVSCPANDSIYLVQPNGLVCVPNSAWDQPGSLCPVGQYLTAYSVAGIQCVSPVNGSGGSPLTCPSGQYLNGFDAQGRTLCLTFSTPIPTGILCSSGQYLYDLVGSVPDCRQTPWPSASSAVSCPSGSALIGWNAGTPLCQQVSFPSSATSSNFSCASGQVLLSYGTASDGGSAGGPNCAAVPDPDTSHACPSGFYLSHLDGKFNCQPLPGGGTGSVCGVGQFLTGFQSGQAVCSPIPIQHLPGPCLAGTYPIGVSNGLLVCSPFPNVQTPNQGQVCAPSSQVLCAMVGGLGEQQCNSAGTGYIAPCTAVVCSSGYRLDTATGTCQPLSCTPGSQSSCPIAHGTGIEICGNNGVYGACQVQSCDSGYFQNGGACVAQSCTPGSTVACSVGQGYGVKVCQPDGTRYSDCNITSCQNGYVLQGNACYDVTPPRVTYSAIPTTPTSGRSANLAYTAIDNESGVRSVTCALDGAPFTPCQSPVALTSLLDGPHRFAVTATDNAGNTFTNTAYWSNQSCAPVNSVIQCWVANGYGARTCQADGTYSGCAAVSCNNGYQLLNGSCVPGNCGAGYNWNGSSCVDQTPPTIQIVSAPTDPTTGTSGTVSFSVADPGSGVASVTCRLDQRSEAPCSSPYTINNLSFGAHQLVIAATDTAGNQAFKTLYWHNVACTPGAVTSCPILNGQGWQTCHGDGSGYCGCQVAGCNPGYVRSGNACVPVGQGPSCPFPWSCH